MPLQRTKSLDFFKTKHDVTFHLGWATAVACLGTLQFGYHLSELNGTQLLLSCNFHRPGPFDSYDETFWSGYGLKECIPIPESDLSLITTYLTVGGLVSSILLGSHTLSSAIGRKVNCIINAGLFFTGSILMAFANSFTMMNVGRFLCGLGAGSSVVISPILVNELTPVNHRGFLGSFLQFSLAMGILLSQFLSVFFANDQQWRTIFLIAAMIGLIQFILLFTILESPKWLITNKNDTSTATSILKNLRSNHDVVGHEINHWRRLSMHNKSPDLESTPLMEDLSNSSITDSLKPVRSRRGSIDPSNLKFYEFLTSKAYRKELIATIIIMSGNQLCGMNCITFYGVIFLQDIVPKSVNILYLTSALALCNVIAALCVSKLFDKFGRKPLLLFSCSVMVITTFMISVGLMNDISSLTTLGCFMYIIGYSFGLGPLVYMMVPEFTNNNAIAIGQSFGTVINWLSNIAIAFFFPLLQDWLLGKVFFIFTFINLFYFTSIIFFVPETKLYHSYEEVWSNFKYF